MIISTLKIKKFNNSQYNNVLILLKYQIIYVGFCTFNIFLKNKSLQLYIFKNRINFKEKLLKN